MRIGLHARNGEFEPTDFDMIAAAGIETLFIMSNLSTATVAKIRELYPGLELICRLYDDRMGVNYHPSPEEFVDKMIPIIAQLSPYCQKFQIHNEPNHPAGYEGWWPDDASAADFSAWLMRVLDHLRGGYPKMSYGFPGLAIPHRDIEWLRVCWQAIYACDWLGAHCYWQTPPDQPFNYLSYEWGLRFIQYHELYPAMRIEITECGNSNNQSGLPLSDNEMAAQLVEYYTACRDYDYLDAVCPFIASSPDPTWGPFAWRHTDGHFKPVVGAVGGMSRVA
jgi:hypothetical protein